MIHILSFFFILTLNSWKEKDVPAKANVILILTDDQGYGDLGIHGNTEIQTPVLDQFALESAQFDRFYVSPLCAPTRASILTGRYHLSTGTISVSNGLETMDAEEYTLAELFKDNGYRTALFGKWHNGQHYPHHPLAQGFDEFTGFLAGHWSNYFDTKLEKNGKVQTFPGYLPDVLTDETLAFIEENQSQPFFAMLSINTPHSPHQVPDEYFNKYKEAGLNDELAAIYGMVSNIDDNVGRVLKMLETLNLDSNTLVIFLTDNGPNGNRYNSDMKGIKGAVHEGGVRVPSFWRWPGQIVPSMVGLPAAHIDILPTLADLLDLKTNGSRTVDGISLSLTLKGKNQQVARPIFSHVLFPKTQLGPYPGAIRKDSLLLALLPSGFELYDLKNDPNQSTDLTLKYPEMAKKLSDEYITWWENIRPEDITDRPIPISKESPEIFLPSYESTFSGDIQFFEGHGWAQDWLTNWKNQSDSISWNLKVLDSGEYEVLIEYTARQDQTGTNLILQSASDKITWVLSEAFISEIISSQDRVARKEAPEQTWKLASMGIIKLQPGIQQLNLKASKIPQSGLGDIYSLRLRPLQKREK